jgi:Integrase core domain
MNHVRGAPLHPQTQGKIECWHQTLKNRILLENYFLPGDLERQIEALVEHYNHQRYHESRNTVIPADAPVVVIAAGRCHTLSRSTAIEWNWQHLLNPVRLRIDKSN